MRKDTDVKLSLPLFAAWGLVVLGAVGLWALQNHDPSEAPRTLPPVEKAEGKQPTSSIDARDPRLEWVFGLPEASPEERMAVVVVDDQKRPVEGAAVAVRRARLEEVAPRLGLTSEHTLDRVAQAWGSATAAVKNGDPASADARTQTGRTGDDGIARFRKPPMGAYDVTVRAGEVVLRRYCTEYGGRFIVAPEAPVSGQVEDWTGAPAVGAAVRVQSDGGGWADTTTDAEGRFQVRVPVSEWMKVTVDVVDGDRGMAGIVGPAGADHRVTLEPFVRVRGFVLNLGDPVRGARVWSGRSETTTDAEGAFELTGLGPLDTTVFAEHDGRRIGDEVPQKGQEAILNLGPPAAE